VSAASKQGASAGSARDDATEGVEGVAAHRKLKGLDWQLSLDARIGAKGLSDTLATGVRRGEPTLTHPVDETLDAMGTPTVIDTVVEVRRQGGRWVAMR
jgi:hypothetical protein